MRKMKIRMWAVDGSLLYDGDSLEEAADAIARSSNWLSDEEVADAIARSSNWLSDNKGITIIDKQLSALECFLKEKDTSSV